MPKPVKWFSNGRGFNFLPDFMERLPTGSRPLVNDPIPYISTNNTVVFWRYYDPITIEEQIVALRNTGINNLRIWFNYYAWKYHDDRGTTLFLDNLRHLTATLDKYGMYCIWVFFDGLAATTTFIPTPGAEYDDRLSWKHFPAASLGLNASFYQNSALPYISAMITEVSGHQSTMGYELMNEGHFGIMSSSTFNSCLSAITTLDTTPTSIRKTAPGFALFLPWHDIGSGGQALNSTQQWAAASAHSTFLTIHPYTAYGGVRSFLVDMGLSAGYDLNIPVYFTEGAEALGYNPYVEFFDWCAASGLGWNVFQAMSPNASGKTYAGFVGIFHPDSEIRMPVTYNYIKNNVVSTLGYKSSWLSNLRTKTYVDNNGDNKSDTFIAPRNHPLYLHKPYSSRYNLSSYATPYDGEYTLSSVHNFLSDWSTSTVTLSSIRDLYPQEAGALPQLAAEYSFQRNILAPFVNFAVLSPSTWGVSGTSVSARFDQYGFTSIELQERISASAEEYIIRAYPDCYATNNCYWGTGQPFGACLGTTGVGDCFDWARYDSFHSDMRDYYCELLAQTGFGACT